MFKHPSNFFLLWKTYKIDKPEGTLNHLYSHASEINTANGFMYVFPLSLSVGSHCVYCLVTGFLDLMMYEEHLSMSISIDPHHPFKKLPSVSLY